MSQSPKKTFSSILTKEFLELHHIRHRKSGVDIAKELGCTNTLVCIALKKHGIPNQSNQYKIGKPNTSATKFKPGVIPWNLGRTDLVSPLKGKKYPRQELHWNWKPDKKPNDRRLADPYYRDWRKEVFVRDNYTCQFCQKQGGPLNADHIKPWSLFPELRYDLNNGRTLCVPCHRTTDTYGGRIFTNIGGVMKSVTIA